MLLHDTLRPAGLHIALLALFRTLPDKYQTLPGYVPPFGGEVLMGDWFRVSSMGIGMMEAISPCMSGRSNEKTPCAASLAPDKTKQLVFGCIDKGRNPAFRHSTRIQGARLYKSEGAQPALRGQADW